jgi:hypothetical protein
MAQSHSLWSIIIVVAVLGALPLVGAGKQSAESIAADTESPASKEH